MHGGPLFVRLRNALALAWREHIPVDPDHFHLSAHPQTLRELHRELAGPDIDQLELAAVLGLPTRPDPALKPGELVLRYEVRA